MHCPGYKLTATQHIPWQKQHADLWSRTAIPLKGTQHGLVVLNMLNCNATELRAGKQGVQRGYTAWDAASYSTLSLFL